MARSEAQKKADSKYEAGKKMVVFRLKDEIYDQFNEKLKQDKLSKQEVLETAVYQYINGELRVNKTK